MVCLPTAKAQKPITLAEDSVKFGNRYFPGFWLSIPEVKPELVKTNWIKAIEKGTKSKVSGNKNEMSLIGANIPDIYKGGVNIVSKILDRDSLIQLFVSVETTRDNFIVSTSGDYGNLKKYLNKFAKGQYAAVAKNQLSAEEAKLKNLEKELKSARKNKEKSDKGIQSANVRISGQNDKISGINKELDILDIKIGNCSTLLSTLDEGDARKAKQSELKDLQKKKKSLLKDINSAENNISKANIAIQDNKKEIELNEVKQTEIGERINQQKLVVDKYVQKLKVIEAY